jgi:hypothetical protein
MKSLKPLFILFIILLSLVVFLMYALPVLKPGKFFGPGDTRGGKEMVIKNYGAAIDSAANVFGLSASYLKALCMLECSGKKKFQARFEDHVYRKLKKVKFKQLSNYEHVTSEMLQDANDEALRNLASSWGPFQLMGYKCLLLNIKIRDIREDQAVYYGAKWIDLTYGETLKEKKFKDAFHIHNTGSPFPDNGRAKTHDPNYCNNGLKHMEWFSKH